MSHFEPRTVVCAVDFSPSTPTVLDAACSLAERFEARLHLVHVWRLPTVGVLDGVQTIPDARETELLITGLKDELRMTAERMPLPRDRVATHLAQGDAALAILELAGKTRCDCIVMGTHGRTGLRHLVMGSVAEQVVRRARLPVLVIPTLAK